MFFLLCIKLICIKFASYSNEAIFKTKIMEAIKKLREYANLRDDWYINSQLDLLENEIKIARNNAKIEVYNKVYNYKNK